MTIAADRGALLRLGRRLELFTILWNSLEGLVSVALGLLAGSIALVGFGIDSFIETSSGIVLLWRLQTRRDAESAERAEATALRLVGASLLALAAYVAYDAAGSLIRREAPEASVPGIVLAAVSLIVMPLLARRKRAVAAALGSQALAADATQTSICMYLSAILLGGLLLNALRGWWWADPVAALAMVPFIAREGREAWRGERCAGE
jgi:divalent metal cation (Fe/Co/Zn/Cd) transporter